MRRKKAKKPRPREGWVVVIALLATAVAGLSFLVGLVLAIQKVKP